MSEESLKLLLERRPLALREIKILFKDLLEAVLKLHEQNCYSCSIQPANIMLTLNAKDKLATVALCSSGDSGRSTAEILDYQSPEQVSGPASPKSAVYSLGLVLLELLSKKSGNARILMDAKKGKFSDDLMKGHKHEVELIKWMLESEEKRLSFNELQVQLGRLWKPITGLDNERYAADFEQGRYLGGGRYGKVYEVQHRTTKQFYAMKIIENADSDSRDEAVALSSLSHDCIVRFCNCYYESTKVGVDEDKMETASSDGSTMDISSSNSGSTLGTESSNAVAGTKIGRTLYIQMELCSMTLATRMENDDCKTKWQQSVCKDLIEAVHYITSKGFIHRDIKPLNIFVTQNDRAKLGDFGLSAIIDSTCTKNMRAGTRLYMSPEQCEGKPSYKSDVYSLGLVMFELLGRLKGDVKRGLFEQLQLGNNKFSDAFGSLEISYILRKIVCYDPKERANINEVREKMMVWWGDPPTTHTSGPLFTS